MPVLDSHSMEFISRSVEQTRRVGMRLGSLLQPGDVICLVGELGSGKTTFAQGVSAGWGSLDAVTSPTFVLINVYRRISGEQLYHFDAYRINNLPEAVDLDLDALLERGPLLVEWADRVLAVLPDEHLKITMLWITEGQRDMLISAHGPRYQGILKELRRHLFGVL